MLIFLATPGALKAMSGVVVDPASTVRVSVSGEGLGGNASSGQGSLSADGRFVVFASLATNLVPGDTNGPPVPPPRTCLYLPPSCDETPLEQALQRGADVFVHDRDADADRVYDEAGATTTERVSLASDGSEAHGAVFGSRYPVISAGGRHVAFTSDAPDLVPGDTNGLPDIFVHDRLTRETRRVSVRTGGEQANGWSWMPSISADGRYIAFESGAFNLIPADANDSEDIFVHDLHTGTTTRVSVGDGGREGNGGSYGPPAISADGRLVAFYSFASNLVAGDTNEDADVFVHDRLTGATERVSVASDGKEANGPSQIPAISGDGRLVAFKSWASNLSPQDGNGEAVDVYVHNRLTRETSLASVNSAGEQANATTVIEETTPTNALSHDGRYLVMLSWATNLAPGATRVFPDVFVRDLMARETWRASISVGGTPAPGSTFGGAVSADGRHVVFDSDSPLLTPGDANLHWDLFVRSRGAGICAAGLPCLLTR